ncbi:retrovirus-related Pol polyprotein from transposon 297 [Trichonephila clavipes]|nr:retrovirus-related Pol polyprotein from transposon 297 [Trichonephila clavipes]
MVVDTEANASIIREVLAQNSQISIIWTPPCVSLQTVTGDKIEVHGKANITLSLVGSRPLKFSHTRENSYNISDNTRTLQEGEVIAACAPVTCVDRKCNTQDLSLEDLVKDLLQNTDLDEKQRCAARGLIKEFQGLFSRTSEYFGRIRLTKHLIDTGEHPPIKHNPPTTTIC